MERKEAQVGSVMPVSHASDASQTSRAAAREPLQPQVCLPHPSDAPVDRHRALPVPRAWRAITTALATRAPRTGHTRSLRFLCVGGLVTLVQLGLLLALARLAVPTLLANALALLLAAQLNFALSSAFTWGDRPPRSGGLAPRWLRFMLAISGTLLINQGLFAVARMALPTLLAAALGSGLTGALNFVLGDRFVFLG
jgi:putative flippase GtrA